MYDLVIKGGKMIDGTGNPWTLVDLAIKDGKIVKIEKNIAEDTKEILDVRGSFVTPGFIDTHVHSDLLCTKPEVHQVKVKQGVTLELLGQDGISVAPINHKTKNLWQKQLKNLNGDIEDWPWSSIQEYLDFLNTSSINGHVAYLVPHGNVRSLVVGFEDRLLSKNEIKEMCDLAEQGMLQGSFGFSSGLVYPPNVFSTTEEIIEVCKVVAKYDGCFVVHMRNESMNILQALEEMLTVARESGVRLHISHLKVIGQKNRSFYPQILKKMEEARIEGIEITFDQYPYTAGSTVFNAILPPWMHVGGVEKMIDKLKSKEIRNKIKDEFKTNINYENWVLNCGWENIVISSLSSEKNKWCEGKSIAEIAKHTGQDPTDTAFNLLIEEEGNITMITHWGLEEDMMSALRHPYQMMGSDGIFGGKPHPRLTGTFPRVLGKYVRQKQVLTWEEAVHHMTGAPAQLLRLKDRGLLKEGYWADIVVFNPQTIDDLGTYDDPLKDPEGIEYVFIDGKPVIYNGVYTNVQNGQVLKYKTKIHA